MVIFILQWNARSLISNGQEFKKYIDDLNEKPDIVCVQESWLISRLEFNIKGYNAVRMDRKIGKGGGIITFIKKGIQYREVKRGNELEYVIVEVWSSEGNIKIINFYNPCRLLEREQLEEIWEGINGKTIWCGDFNAHSTLWGNRNDNNGRVIEEFIEEEELVCINDGTGTRLNTARGTESAIDITIVTKDIADRCEWEVLRGNTVGSDHYPIKTQVGIECAKEIEVREEKWILERADWDKFREISEDLLQKIEDNLDVENMCKRISGGIIEAAKMAIPKSKPKIINKIVPWWTKECRKAIKERNKAFKKMKTTHNFQNLMKYKQAQAIVRKTVKKSKKEYWRQFCESIGRTTPVERVWGMIKKMKGNGKEYGYPMLMDG